LYIRPLAKERPDSFWWR